MSYYGNDKKTHIIDPIFKSENRIEYRFPANTVFTSQLRVCDLKTTSGKGFNRLLGAKGLVKNIYLYDGATTLDQQRNGYHYNGFINLINSGGMSSIGFVRDKHNGSRIAQRTAYKGGSSQANDSVAIATINPNVNTESTQIWLNIQELLPICNSALGFDTSIMDNLRLVIELQTDVSKILTDRSGGATSSVSAFNPVLVIDELLADADKQRVGQSLSNLEWNTIEHDSFLLPEVASNSGVQTLSTRINGFNGKKLGRLLIAKERDQISGVDNNGAGADNQFGTAGSQSLYQEKVNLAVNGRNIYVDEGVDSKMKRVARTVDTWGNYQIVPSNNLNAQSRDDAPPPTYFGKVDYLGVGVMEDRLTDLQIHIERNVPTDRDNKVGKQMTYHVYGEVLKGLTVSGNNYSINYL